MSSLTTIARAAITALALGTLLAACACPTCISVNTARPTPRPNIAIVTTRTAYFFMILPLTSRQFRYTTLSVRCRVELYG